MNKKTKIAILAVIALVLVTIGVTYAYWLVTRTQTGQNEITAGCLDIAISGEANDISLPNQFPISDEEGMELVPYEFTVTNNCNTSVDYQVALEATGIESSAMSTSSIKVALNDSVSLLSLNAEVDTTISGAYESRRLGFSRLAASGSEGSSDTYKLRIWIDEDAPISEMNKTFTSKISVTIGQGIESPYEEGTLAYSILSNYGGSEGIECISVEPTDMIIATGNLFMLTQSNYYYGTEVSLDKTTGKYTLSGILTQATTTECRNGTKTCGKYTFRSTSSTDESATLYEVMDFQNSGSSVTANTIQYTTEFGKVTTASDAGLYKTQDDLGDSYYFRGNQKNNYVQFGTYAEDYTKVRGYYSSTSTDYRDYTTLEECNAAASYNYKCAEYVYAEANDPMYWRIVRINGDGTIRLIYDGVEKVVNGTAHTATIGRTAYNTYKDDAKYVGYTYEGTNDAGETVQLDSTIKGVVDVWYDKHLETTYGTYIADSIFCNDRQDDNADNYYAPYDRLRSNKTPSLKCTNKSDRYTTSEEIGNGLLSNPVGLITADEVMMAGGTTPSSNKTYYLYSGESYWTSAPNSSDGSNAGVWLVFGGDTLNSSYVDYSSPGARPVINLKADVEFTGDGTIDNPYKIVTE